MRVITRLVAALVALAVAVAGLVAATEIVLTHLDRPATVVPWDRWYRSMAAATWRGGVVPWVFTAVLIGGLALVAVALAPRRPRVVTLRPADGIGSAALRRRDLDRSLARTASAVVGVGRVRTRTGRRAVDVKAQTDGVDVSQLPAIIRDQLDARLRTLQVEPAVPVEVHMVGKAPA